MTNSKSARRPGTLCRDIVRELLHYRANAALSIAGAAVAVAVTVAFLMIEDASQREVRRLTRDMGFNVRIIPRQANPDAFLLNGYTEETMPEDTVQRLANTSGISYNHLVASLQRKTIVAGVEALLVGLSEEYAPPGKKKPPMGFRIRTDEVHLGHRLAQRWNLTQGDALDLHGRSFRVERVLVESGTLDDLRIFAALEDAQRILELEGRISEIKAIDCLCLTATENPLRVLREELETVLPEAQVFHMTTMADARAKQRRFSERSAALIVPLIITVSLLWLGVLATFNVRQRRDEIGLRRAIGHGDCAIAMRLLGRALVLGIVAATLGYLAGTAVVLHWGADVFQVTAASLRPAPQLFLWSLGITPLFAMLASLLPMTAALRTDPAAILSET